jgi:DNA-binding GntR family transcriptional regulator
LTDDNANMSKGIELVCVEGKEGKFVEKPSMLDKYQRRDLEGGVEELCYAQFCKEYTPGRLTKTEEKREEQNYETEVDVDEEVKEKDRIVTSHGSGENLPKVIKLNNV